MSPSRNIFLEIISNKDESPVVIFDLDSTLYNVSPRTQAILDAFLNTTDVQKNYPEEYKALHKVKIANTDWGLRHALERHGFSSNPEFHKRLRDYWRAHFFSSLYLMHDEPYAGAVGYVTALYKNGAQIYYLTGRDEQNMKSGTLKSLSQWNLPLNSEKHLIMKPHKGSHEDHIYKDLKLRELMESLKSQNGKTPKIWFFENEPMILQTLRKTNPDVKLIWVDTTHSGRALPPEDILTVKIPWVY